MTNIEKVLDYLQRNAPNSFSNADLVNRTGVRPHNQVFQITRRLMEEGRVQGRLFGKDWLFWCDTHETRAKATPLAPAPQEHPQPVEDDGFLPMARSALSRFYGTALREPLDENVAQDFPMASEDGSIVCDALYLTSDAKILPPSQLALLSERVWLLEKVPARTRVLALGGQRRIPMAWLQRHISRVGEVELLFVANDGSLTKLG